MARVTLTVAPRWRWWFRFYLAALRLSVVVTGMEPNWQRVESWIRRGLVTHPRPANPVESHDGRTD
jgi:hypothetical protein